MYTIAQLKAELTTDPAGIGYAALIAAGNQAGLAGALNQGRYTGLADLSAVAAYCLVAGITGKVRAATFYPDGLISLLGGTMTFALRSTCWTFLTLLENSFRLNWVDVTNNAFTAGCTALIGANLMTSADQTAMTALGAATRSRAAELWGDGTVATLDDVATALRS